jgi:hypothetical protein
MTCHAFLGGRRGGFPRLGNIIVAAAAFPMESLLVIQDYRFSSSFNLDLRQRRQQLWLLVRPGVAIVAQSHWRRAGILLEEIGSQGCSSIRRPRSLVRRMLRGFGCRLRRVMTLNAGNGLRSINTAILGDVVGVAKLYGA